MSKTRIRFAPSPTGFLHIGSLRTVLFDYLLAKQLNGKLILRIEDTDQKRKVEGSEEGLVEILDWLGLKFDEGPHVGGKFGPYKQSERLDIYKKHIEGLLKENKAYYCFCTPERLEKMRKEQQERKQPPRYDRCCRNLSKSDIEKKIKADEKYVIRQKMPNSGELVVRDELRGDIKFKASELEDHVLIKSDGWPTYQFAVVVDDHEMEISHVVRGEEWIPSFPKNILLYQAFGWNPPKFYHMPLTLNKDGGKLSKRQGDVAVEDYRTKGYLPEALINFSVLLGWHPKGDNEIYSLKELEKKFKVNDIGTSAAVFDIEKLDYFNGYYIRQKSINELTALCVPYLASAGFIDKAQSYMPQAQNECLKTTNRLNNEISDYEYVKKIVALEQERLKKLSEIAELTDFFFVEKFDYSRDLLIWKKMSANEVKNNLEQIQEQLEKIPKKNWTNDSIEDAIMSFIKASNGKVGEYLWPMRASLTGRKASPGPFDVAEVLGKAESIKRIKKAVEKL